MRQRMMDVPEIIEQDSEAIERRAAQRAKDRARAARWDLDVAVFFFAISIIVIILMFQGVGLEIVAPAAILGLAMGWLMGWRKGKQLYERFYDEELSRLELDLMKAARESGKATIEEIIQKAFCERWR